MSVNLSSATNPTHTIISGVTDLQKKRKRSLSKLCISYSAIVRRIQHAACAPGSPAKRIIITTKFQLPLMSAFNTDRRKAHRVTILVFRIVLRK